MLLEIFYHIYNHANVFENLYKSEENYRFFLQQWTKYIEPLAETHAYCLVPNHFHCLIKVRDVDAVRQAFNFEEGTFGKFQTFQKLVSKQFANLFSSYTQAFNKQQKRKGSLFMPNFKRKIIENDAYLTNVIIYIHHNPVHHGFTKRPLDWPHSSLHTLLSAKPTLLARRAVIDWFGGKEHTRDAHNEPLKELDKMELEFT